MSNIPPVRSGQPIEAAHLNKIRDAVNQLEKTVQSQSPRPSQDIGHRTSAGGTTSFIKRTAAAGSNGERVECLLGTLSAGTQPDTKKITAGWIWGGSASHFLQLDNITPKIDDFIYIECTVTVDVIDGVLMNTFTFTGAGLKVGSTAPVNTALTYNAPTGKMHYPIGKWISNEAATDPQPVWKATGCGNVVMKMCGGQALFIRNGNPQYASPEQPAE